MKDAISESFSAGLACTAFFPSSLKFSRIFYSELAALGASSITLLALL